VHVVDVAKREKEQKKFK